MKCVVCGCIRSVHEAMETQVEHLSRRCVELQNGHDMKVLTWEHDAVVAYLHAHNLFADFMVWKEKHVQPMEGDAKGIQGEVE